MTLDNSRRLYEHYLSIGNTKAANELLSKYPQLAPKKPVEEEKPISNSKPNTTKKKVVKGA